MNTLEITSLAHGGYGVGRIDRQVWFVPYGLPGDILQVSEARRSHGIVWGKIEEIPGPSPHRVQHTCPVFGSCGACTWLHFAYPAQLEWKQRIVLDTLKRLGGVEPRESTAIEDPELRLGYRTRAEFQGDGWKRGFYAEGSHDVIDVTMCPLCHPKLNAALTQVREANVTGPVEITVNPEGDDVLIWTAKPNRRLLKALPSAQSFESSEDRRQFQFDGVPIINGAFSQSSLLLNRTLRSIIHETLAGAENVLDLYCGSGNLSLALDADVIGIDRNRAGIAAAQALQRHDYRDGDDGDIICAVEAKPWGAILLDPPRTGAIAIMQALAESGAARIVYTSCDPATLARDAKVLIKGGWIMTRATVVDMFPNTAHIETVGVFERA